MARCPQTFDHIVYFWYLNNWSTVHQWHYRVVCDLLVKEWVVYNIDVKLEIRSASQKSEQTKKDLSLKCKRAEETESDMHHVVTSSRHHTSRWSDITSGHHLHSVCVLVKELYFLSVVQMSLLIDMCAGFKWPTTNICQPQTYFMAAIIRETGPINLSAPQGLVLKTTSCVWALSSDTLWSKLAHCT